MTTEEAAWVATIVAAVLGLVAIVQTARANRLQARLVEIEQGRDAAAATAQAERLQCGELQVYLSGAYPSTKLVVENVGLCEAREIEILLDGQPLTDHCVWAAGQEPVRFLSPASSRRMVIAPSMDCAPPFDVLVRWLDESGQRETRAQVDFE